MPPMCTLMSRELDVSYSAAAWQLVTLDKIRLDARAARRAGCKARRRRREAAPCRPGPPPDGGQPGRPVPSSTPHAAACPCCAGPATSCGCGCPRTPRPATYGDWWDRTGQLCQAPSGMEARCSWKRATDAVPRQSRRGGTGNRRNAGPAARGSVPAAERPDGGLDKVVGTTGMRELIFVAQTPGSQDLPGAIRPPEESDQMEISRLESESRPGTACPGFSEARRRSHVARLIGAEPVFEWTADRTEVRRSATGAASYLSLDGHG